ncbi:OmpA family protein [Phenylobacterium sp.]|jgi:outer membrane protein OmpA-like peptidoglycan-associated protein|uniref:OmpA family protein n=1 Tax=Phenylobacterium sp. TaxID=1871053 RepID=UPI002E2FC7A3|nr:OmpA family protein [Phenylobacterium sp.]HEX3363721.1 OmpA family protein [Phenylobacterium sp.]
MQHRALFSGLAVAVLCAGGLSACLTPHIQPPASPAIIEARTAAQAKAPACMPGGLDQISPVDAAFAFGDTEISPQGGQRLAVAARWLVCNHSVETVIRPDGDNHGDDAHMDALANGRAKSVADKLRELGATGGTLRILSRGAPDPVTAPHLLINATGRGW